MRLRRITIICQNLPPKDMTITDDCLGYNYNTDCDDHYLDGEKDGDSEVGPRWGSGTPPSGRYARVARVLTLNG